MPQETNLNVPPYFDDFDPEKNYQKVLFKPGYPVQARELTTLQTILQNQIEQQGKHLFKEGSVVIPGQIRIDNPIYAVQIEDTYVGTPISLYFDNLLGKKLRGSNSGVLAEVVYTLSQSESERGTFTLYVKYIENGGLNFENDKFFDAETLILQSDLTYGNLGFTIQSGEGICNTISSNSNSLGSSAVVANGVYFVRGYFATVLEQRIILDQYGSSPSYKIGFDIIESIISADEDNSLFDNAKGFSNYTAPGADRFKIDLILSKRRIDDSNTDNFVEIIRIENGNPTFKKENTQYSLIRDELARRTYDESGNYYIKPFEVTVRESLNDRIRSDGLYYSDQSTVDGSTPSDDLMVYKIGPGKAYVNGYDVEKISSSEITVEKPRTTRQAEDEIITYNAGTTLFLNRGFGSPPIGLGNTYYVELMDSRIGVSSHIQSGEVIGLSRIYDFVPETDYVDNTSRLNLRLFDIQTFTKVGLTTNIQSIQTPALIKGKRSKASGYLKESVSNSRSLVLYNVSGSFLENEPITINGIDNGRIINEVIDYNISDIKSVYCSTGISTFNADIILSQKTEILPPGTEVLITGESSGISTVSAGLNFVFTNKIKTGDIISYSNLNSGSNLIYNKVENVSSDGLSFTISGITTVNSICDGALPSVDINVNNIIKVTGLFDSSDSSLMTRLRFENISNLSLENQEILQRRQFTNISFSDNFIQLTLTEPDLFFSSFDEDRFIITYSDGSLEPMRFDKYNLDTTGKILTFYGLTRQSGTASVITTVKNINPTSKAKRLNKVSTIIIDKSQNVSSGIGTTTLNDGLQYSTLYGTRVQDDEICLNYPDVVRVLGVYESSNSLDPQLPKIQLGQINGSTSTNQDFLVGEEIVGRSSGAVALIVERSSTDSLEYIYLNSNQFSLEEEIFGKQSNVSGIIINKIISSSKDIGNNFYFDDGQRPTMYDYSRLIRKENSSPPSRKLKIVFQNYVIDSGDTGEFITVNSYPSEGFKYDVPLFNNTRLTDYVDIRPRVSPFNPNTELLSPFEFKSRKFNGEGQYSKYSLCPGENLRLSYSYYLPRTDILYLDSSGNFKVAKGLPNEISSPPEIPINSFDVAIITIPPYLFNTKNVSVTLVQHKRYRMKDISLLEDRIDRLEKYTTLSIQEQNTENYSIKDPSTGLDKFKCGFFVDNFSSHEYHDLENPLFRTSIDTTTNTLRPIHHTTSLELQLGSESISGFTDSFSSNADQSFPSNIGSGQIRKTGELVTLNYTEVLYDSQLLSSTTENVVPYLVGYWEGSVELRPSFDDWVEERRITTTTTVTNDPIQIQNNSDDISVATLPPNPNPGVSQFDWISNFTDRVLDPRFFRSSRFWRRNRRWWNGRDWWWWSRRGRWGRWFRGGLGSRYTRTIELTSRDLVDRRVSNGIVNGNTIRLEWKGGRNSLNGTKGRQYSSFVRDVLPPDIAEDYLRRIQTGRGIVSVEFTPTIPQSPENPTIPIPPTQDDLPTEDIVEETTTINETTQSIEFLRSRNIEFDIKALKPRTRFEPFFENINISNYIIPKLLEITMVSGAFEVGETIESDPHFTSAKIKFRLCSPNHKTGPYNLPQEIYTLNPYNQTPFEENYTQSSTVLNVDTRSLQLPTEVDFYGSVSTGMRIIGKKTGAVATINGLRLITDNHGRLIGSFFVPDSTVPGNPKWINGQNTFKVVASTSLNSNANVTSLESSTDSSAETEFSSSGSLNITETNIISTRTPVVVIPAPTPPTPPVQVPQDYEICSSSPLTIDKNPALTTSEEAFCGWFSRVNDNDNSPYEDVGDFVIKWGGSVVFDSQAGNRPYSRTIIREYSGEVDQKLSNQMISNYTRFITTLNTRLREEGVAQKYVTNITRGDPASLLYPVGSWGVLVGEYVYFPIFGSGKFISDSGWTASRGALRIDARQSRPVTSIWDVIRVKVSAIPPELRPARRDPLAQSFIVEDETGIFVTSIEVFFETKDDNIPVILQLRPMIAGVPSNVIIPFSEVTLDPSSVNVSADGTVATRFTFPSPVYLSGPQQQEVRVENSETPQSSEYAIVLLSDSPNYRVFISRIGDNDIGTGTRISTQPTLGSLFKSQNGSTWNPSQYEDLKYRVYRASFGTSGIVRFFNSKLSVGNDKSTVTSTNSFIPLSKKIIVGLGSTGFDVNNVIPGITLSQGNSKGKLVGIGGSASGSIVINSGIGYSVGTYQNVILETETGFGRGATATIDVDASGVSDVTITDGGFGYVVGDTVKIPRIENLGFGAKATITSIASNNAFVIDEVQGTFSVGITTINYINSSGVLTPTGIGVTISTIIEDKFNDGLHMKVIHQNHGMHSVENYVKIEEFRPTSDEVNSYLTEELVVDGTTISVESGIGFTFFEGSEVSESNPGYIIIGNEVIGYTSVSGNNLISSSLLRGVDGTQVQSYSVNTPVFKYEFNGISIRRINKVHNFAEVDTSNHPIDFNSYYIKIETNNVDFEGNEIGVNRKNDLYFKQTLQSGRAGTVISNNIQYEVLSAKVNSISPSGTEITSRVRTFTGTSLSGNEKSFVDAGYQDFPLNARLYFQTPRIICSDINEQKFITESPERRSFSMDVIMSSTDERVSPIIDIVPPPSLILTSNLINSPIGLSDVSLYSNSDSVRGINDPHASVYVSRPISLSIPANSLKVLLSANKNDTNDIRVLYQIIRQDQTFNENSYQLFPGYTNYKLNGIGGNISNISLSDGTSDFFVNEPNDGEFKEYIYTADNLPEFTSFVIKIVLAGTNQASPPLISNLRAIATTLPSL